MGGGGGGSWSSFKEEQLLEVQAFLVSSAPDPGKTLHRQNYSRPGRDKSSDIPGSLAGD